MKKIDKEVLENAYKLAGSYKKAGELLGLSSTKFRQQYLNSNNLCIQCVKDLDKTGLICATCLKENREKVKIKLGFVKSCTQCKKEIQREENKNNISWAKQKICRDCLRYNYLETGKAHYVLNKEKYLEKSRNRKEYYKQYRKTAKCRFSKRKSNNKRRAQKYTTQIEDLTEHLKQLFEKQKYCFYCLEKCDKFQIEHKIPLARNGTHTKDNIVLSCVTCNLKKGTKTSEEFLIYNKD